MDNRNDAPPPVDTYDEHTTCCMEAKENNMSSNQQPKEERETKGARRPKAARREIPQHWAVLMDRKEIPSIRRLAEAAKLDHVSVNKVVYGDKPASERVVQAIAGALEIDMKTAYRLMGQPVRYAEPWNPPACSARMTQEQRRVIEDAIYVFVEGARPGMGPRHTVEEVAAARREMVAPEDVHPERDNLDLAADTSHGLSQWQRWEDEDEAQA